MSYEFSKDCNNNTKNVNQKQQKQLQHVFSYITETHAGDTGYREGYVSREDEAQCLLSHYAFLGQVWNRHKYVAFIHSFFQF